MATAEEIKAFRAQENLEGMEPPKWMMRLFGKKKVDHAGLGDLEWLSEFQEGAGPNVLVAGQETFTNPGEFAKVIGPNKDASVEDKIALYLEIRDPKGNFDEGFRYKKGDNWSWKYGELPDIENDLFGKNRGLIDYDDDREDDESSTQLWEKSDRAMKGQDIKGGVAYMHPATLDSDIKNQQALWQHESLHGVFEEITDKANLDPWFKSLMESKEIKAKSGVAYDFEEMVTRLVDAKRNGDVEGLKAIVNIPENTRILFDEYRSGKKDGQEVRDALKTTLSYFMMEEILTQASYKEYMGQDYLKEIEEMSAHFSKSLDDAPIDKLFDMVLERLEAQDVDSWIPEGVVPAEDRAKNDMFRSLEGELTGFWNDSVKGLRDAVTKPKRPPLTIEIRK
jgi:hypothetical protein